MEGYLVMGKPQLPGNSSNSNISNTTTSSSSNTYIPADTGFSNKMAQSVSAPWQDHEQPPQYTNDYLTPTNPDQTKAHAQRPPQIPAFPLGGFGRQTSGTSQSSVSSRGGGDGRHMPRTDSGIEADFGTRGPLTSTSTANPRSSTIYECIDSNQYTEPSPHFIRGPSSGGETTSSGVSTATTTTTAAYLVPRGASDSDDVLDDDVRRRLHPAYSSLNHSSPQVYMEAGCCAGRSASKKSLGDGMVFATSPRQLRFLWCGLVSLTLITLFLLAIIAYLFFYLIPGMQGHIRVQEDDFKSMQTDYRKLNERVDTLLWYPKPNNTLSTSAAIQQITTEDGVAVKISELNNSVLEFGSRLQQLGNDLQFQIDNMTDLKAVSAVGNLNSCFYTSTTSSQALPGPSSTTSWLPREGSDQLRDNMVMSVTCSVEGGDQHFVESRKVLSNPLQMQYRCHCDGNLSGKISRNCRIHFVLCPRKLPVDLTAVEDPPVST